MLTAGEFSLYRGEITQVVGEIDSGASFFEKLPSGIQESGKLLMRKIVEAEYE